MEACHCRSKEAKVEENGSFLPSVFFCKPLYPFHNTASVVELLALGNWWEI